MYATLWKFNEYVRGLDTTTDDNLKLRLLREAEGIVKQYTGWDFEPRCATYRFNAPQAQESVGAYGTYFTSPPQIYRSARELRLTEPLLELESGFNGDGTALTLTDLLYLPPYIYPRYGITFKYSTGYQWENDSDGNYEQVIPLTGLWGYHEDWSNAFIDSFDTVQDVAFDDAATTLTVADSTGLNARGETQRFQVGQILKLFDVDGYEYLYVSAIAEGADPAPDTLTVTRGYKGTTARAWDQNTPIYIYTVQDGVEQATLEIARLLYRRKDLDAGDAKQILGTGIRISPATIPDYIIEMMPAPRSWL